MRAMCGAEQTWQKWVAVSGIVIQLQPVQKLPNFAQLGGHAQCACVRGWAYDMHVGMCGEYDSMGYEGACLGSRADHEHDIPFTADQSTRKKSRALSGPLSVPLSSMDHAEP